MAKQGQETNSRAHLRASTAPKLVMMEFVKLEEPPPIPDMTLTREDYRGYHTLTQIP